MSRPQSGMKSVMEKTGRPFQLFKDYVSSHSRIIIRNVLIVLLLFVVVFLSVGLLVSNIIFVTAIMLKPISGEPVALGDYFKKGNPKLHLIGILGGAIWSLGMSFSIIAAGSAGPAISYGLGQGATMIAALWGVFIWKEFKDAPKGTNKLIAAMFFFFIVGLALIIAARVMPAATSRGALAQVVPRKPKNGLGHGTPLDWATFLVVVIALPFRVASPSRPKRTQ